MTRIAAHVARTAVAVLALMLVASGLDLHPADRHDAHQEVASTVLATGASHPHGNHHFETSPLVQHDACTACILALGSLAAPGARTSEAPAPAAALLAAPADAVGIARPRGAAHPRGPPVLPAAS